MAGRLWNLKLETAVFAPTGRRIVATGEAPAAAQRAVRNPWERSCFNISAPQGAADCSSVGWVLCTHAESGSRRRAQTSFRRPKNLRRPAGAKKEDKEHPLPTGSATPEAASLHPWLQSVAPSGLTKPDRLRLGPECIGSGRIRYVYFPVTCRIVADGSVTWHRGGQYQFCIDGRAASCPAAPADQGKGNEKIGIVRPPKSPLK